MSLEHRAPKMIQPEPRVWAQERGPSCWFGTAFHRGGGFGSGDPADPESGAPAGTHERPRAFPAWPHAYKAGRPLPNHTFPTGWGGRACQPGREGLEILRQRLQHKHLLRAQCAAGALRRRPLTPPSRRWPAGADTRVRAHACVRTSSLRFPVPVGRGEHVGVGPDPLPPSPRPFCGPSILKRPCVRFLFLAPSGS